MKRYDVIVVGAGPAGIAAATAVARYGRSVLLLDDNPAAGGQIWREGISPSGKRGNKTVDEKKDNALCNLVSSGATMLFGYRVFDAPALGTLQALRETDGDPEVVVLQYRRLILATGARELFLPFPGWTSPGVFGVGGLQALVRGGFDIQASASRLQVRVRFCWRLLFISASTERRSPASRNRRPSRSLYPSQLRFGLIPQKSAKASATGRL